MTMSLVKKQPIALIILDGFGHSDQIEGNAIALARTPSLDSFARKYPHTLIAASSARVGLPRSQMGNSEVGHLNIGAGRVVPLDINRIDEAILSGQFSTNPGALITSNHGNVEEMIDRATGQPHTAHTTNPVPLLLCDSTYSGSLRSDGALEDVAPTLLALLGIEPPAEMVGRNLMLSNNSWRARAARSE